MHRGQKSSRTIVGDFQFDASAVIVTSGGIGGNLDLVRQHWPVERLGPAPGRMVTGVPHHVDGRMPAITQAAGGAAINGDRMWHYKEGIKTSKKWLSVIRSRLGKGGPAPVEAFKQHGDDFIVCDDLRGLVAGMNALAKDNIIDYNKSSTPPKAH